MSPLLFLSLSLVDLTHGLPCDSHENARCDESKTTKVFTPETNPINIKKKARDEALAAQGLPPPKSSKPTKKRPSTSLLDSSATSTPANSAPKRARQASSTSKATKSSLGETPEVLTDPDEARPDGSGGRDLLLAHKFDLDGKIDPKGWWVSEKRASLSLFSIFKRKLIEKVDSHSRWYSRLLGWTNYSLVS